MQSLEATPLLVDTSRITLRHLNDEEFELLCKDNPDVRLELTAAGELVTMSPVGGGSGKRELRLGGQVLNWSDATQLGEAFSSSTIFKLPLGGKRSPDVAWVARSRWEALTLDEQEKFPRLAPDFVIELRSRTDDLSDLQEKMIEYRDNGVKLGWLINPQDRQVEIYRLDREVETLQSPNTLSGEDILPGFILDLSLVW
jgi:Uma2 family endonuclease